MFFGYHPEFVKHLPNLLLVEGFIQHEVKGALVATAGLVSDCHNFYV